MSAPARVLPIADLWDGLNPRGFARGVFLVQKCFVDESYDDKTFVLSCSIGPGERWDRFQTAWQGVLDAKNDQLAAEGRKQIRRYHATDCAGRRKEFKGWDVEEQKELTAALIGALRLVPMQSVAYTLLLRDLREVYAERLGREMDGETLKIAAYMLTTQFCLIRLGELVWGLNPYMRISVIHDHSDYDDVMLQAFNYLKYTVKAPFMTLFSTIAPMNSVECLPLQLADFLAYEFFRDRGGEETGKETGEAYRRRKSLDLTLQTGTGVSLRTIKKEAIEEILGYNMGHG